MLRRRPRHLRSNDSNAAPTIAEPIDVALDEWSATRLAFHPHADAQRAPDLGVLFQKLQEQLRCSVHPRDTARPIADRVGMNFAQIGELICVMVRIPGPQICDALRMLWCQLRIPGKVGEIIPESWAASHRNDGRIHLGIVGAFSPESAA